MFGNEGWDGERHRETTRADRWFWRVFYFAVGLFILQVFLTMVLLTLVAMNFSELFGFVWGSHYIVGWF